MKVTYLPHTADIRMLIEGDSLEALFNAGLRGMANILKEDLCDLADRYEIKTRITINALDFTNLLVDFLSEVLSNSYAHRGIYCKLDILSMDKNELVADVFGVDVDEYDEEIKAVTYHEAQVKLNASQQWECCIIFDI